MLKNVTRVSMDQTAQCNAPKVVMEWTANAYVVVGLNNVIMWSVVLKVSLSTFHIDFQKKYQFFFQIYVILNNPFILQL